MRCSKRLKIYLLVSYLLVLVLAPTYSLDEAEAQELTEILMSLNSGLTTLQSGLDEIESGQEELEGELNVLNRETKKLEADLKRQEQELKSLRALQKDLRLSYIEMERMNKWLTIGAASATGIAVAAMAIAIFG